MELLFETKSSEFLREAYYGTISQEETGETIVPDSDPDVGQILHAFGLVVLRGKDSRNGSISISGGIHGGVVYQPEDGSAPRTLHLYMPFTVRLEHPSLTEHSLCDVDCRIRSADARILNSRKVLMRVSLCGGAMCYEPASQEVCQFETAEDLQLRTVSYPVIRAMEYAEKPFPMTEEVELPAGRAPMAELCRYQADLEVQESKMLGNRGVYKGNVQLKLLYRTEEEELVPWSCQLPFSQYVEFEQEYENEEELETHIALTDISVEDANGQGKRLLVNMQLLAQCTVVGTESVEVVEDAYSLHHEFVPQWRPVETDGRLDRQVQQENLRAQVQAPVQSVVDTQVYLGDPTTEREGENIVVTVPATANVLYFDHDGQLQGTTVRMETACRTVAAENCVCRAVARPAGEAFAVPSGDGLEVRCGVAVTMDTLSRQTFRSLSGGQMSDEPVSTADRPSVILRTAGPNDSLWSLAKACCSTTEAICAANGISEEALPEGMLLIPVCK